jgi:hypothetical protein
VSRNIVKSSSVYVFVDDVPRTSSVSVDVRAFRRTCAGAVSSFFLEFALSDIALCDVRGVACARVSCSHFLFLFNPENM